MTCQIDLLYTIHAAHIVKNRFCVQNFRKDTHVAKAAIAVAMTVKIHADHTNALRQQPLCKLVQDFFWQIPTVSCKSMQENGHVVGSLIGNFQQTTQA